MSKPSIKAADFREIGWTLWDPIALKEADGNPPKNAEDEYDTYLLHAAGMLINGKGVAAARDYLAKIEADYMGLGDANLAAIQETVRAIQRRLVELGYKDD
ncbi:MAG: hypothetical protein QNJ67_09790 [Kiloniellales bacterium]|nr:hypothetical protein [Kiloniellales bacterium]